MNNNIFPKVSILIPVFNRENFIVECIESALAQTYKNIEVVVVDNASSDNTWKICQQFAKNDPRIRIFQNESNIGPVLNWKRCIDEAKGEFGKILFSDDIIMPRFLEVLLPYFENPEVGFAFSTVEIGNGTIQGKITYNFRKKSGLLKSSLFIDGQFFGGNLPVSPGAALFRINDLKQNLYTDILSPMHLDFLGVGGGVDLLIYLLTANQYPLIAYSNQSLCFFRNHQESITTVYNSNNRLCDYYRQAKVCFASKEKNRFLLDCLLIYIWYLDVKKYKKWIDYNSIYQKYLDISPTKITKFYFIRLVVTVFLKKILF